jgi:hypothetical protein
VGPQSPEEQQFHDRYGRLGPRMSPPPPPRDHCPTPGARVMMNQRPSGTEHRDISVLPSPSVTRHGNIAAPAPRTSRRQSRWRRLCRMYRSRVGTPQCPPCHRRVVGPATECQRPAPCRRPVAVLDCRMPFTPSTAEPTCRPSYHPAIVVARHGMSPPPPHVATLLLTAGQQHEPVPRRGRNTAMSVFPSPS